MSDGFVAPRSGLAANSGSGTGHPETSSPGAVFSAARVWELMSFTNYIDNIFCSGCSGAVLSAGIRRGETPAAQER